MAAMFSLSPPILRRDLSLFFMGILLFLTITPLMAMNNAGIRVFGSQPFTIIAVVMFAIGGIVLITWSVVSCRRTLQKVEAHQYLICGYCGYDVSVMNNDQCPECGARIDVDQLKRIWKRYTERYLNFDIYQDHIPRPNCFKRLSVKYIVFFIVMFVVYASVLGLCFLYSNATAVPLSLGFMIFIPVMMKLIDYRLLKNLCERLNRENSMVCLECGSNVTADGEHAICTACKTTFTTAELIEKWEHWQTLCWPAKPAPKPLLADPTG